MSVWADMAASADSRELFTAAVRAALRAWPALQVSPNSRPDDSKRVRANPSVTPRDARRHRRVSATWLATLPNAFGSRRRVALNAAFGAFHSIILDRRREGANPGPRKGGDCGRTREKSRIVQLPLSIGSLRGALQTFSGRPRRAQRARAQGSRRRSCGGIPAAVGLLSFFFGRQGPLQMELVADACASRE